MLANHSVFTIILVNCRARASIAKLASPPSTGNKLIGPAGELSATVVHVEERRLRFDRFGAGLVHLLDDLERQDDVADFIRLAVPDELDLALVVEKQEAILLRQRLISFEEADDVLLFGGR